MISFIINLNQRLMFIRKYLLLLPGLLLLLIACSPPEPAVREIESPAGPSSQLPYLTVDRDGTAFLSWAESHDSTGTVLKYARLDESTWSTPSTISHGDDWFVNWADFPTITVAEGNPLAAHWLHKIPGNTYSYEIRLTMASSDGEWGAAVTPHSDGTATEHGFVSLIPWANSSVLAVWLDGRRTAGRAEDEYADLSKAMTLRSAVISRDGSVTESRLIDESVCDCCQTSLAATGRGAIAAYRDRTGDEIRDIYVSRYRDGVWSEPTPVHEDNWKIGGCPVNGPAVAAREDRVLAAWFTGAGERSRVMASFSSDGGATFREPIRIDNGAAIGRVDAVLSEAGISYVSWMEQTENGAELRARTVDYHSYSPGAAITVTPMDPSRSSGFPQMVLQNRKLLFAWTETGNPTRIRTALLPIESLDE